MELNKRLLWPALALLTLTGCGTNSSVSANPVAPTVTGASATPAPPTVVPQVLTIDLTSIANYSARTAPVYYDGTVDALDNSRGFIDDRVATLGRVLFYDKKLSVNDTISCSSCHQQALGFADAARFSPGFQGASSMSAHAPRLGNVRYFQPGTMFWNKRAATLEAQATQPITDAFEMGFTAANGGFAALINKMNGLGYYPELFTFAFGDAVITESRVQQALAQFQRAMVSSASRWDSAYAQVFTSSGDRNINVDLPGFTAEENRGRSLFMGNAGAAVTCSTCHAPPTFALAADARGIGLDAGESTVFKAPSLKNVGLTGPYMHDGRFASLDQVLQHYNNGIRVGPALDDRFRNGNGGVRSFNLSGVDRAALAAFLRTLSDFTLTTDARFSNPFRQ